MQIDAAERHLELRKGVQPRFFGTPIKYAAPILHELPEIAEIGAEGPRVLWGLVGETGAGEPVAEIGNCLVGNSQRDGSGRAAIPASYHLLIIRLLFPSHAPRERGLIRHRGLADLGLFEGRHYL